MAVTGASVEWGGGGGSRICLCFAVGMGEVLLLGGAGHSERDSRPGVRPTTAPPRWPPPVPV